MYRQVPYEQQPYGAKKSKRRGFRVSVQEHGRRDATPDMTAVVAE
jgi:hypothetical protein